MSCRPYFFLNLPTNPQIRHQATHKVGCQPGDCIYMVTSIFPRGLCGYVWVNILTLSSTRGLMVLAATGNTNRIIHTGHPFIGGPSYTLRQSLLYDVIPDRGPCCIVIYLCWVKVLRPGCVLPPSLLFQTICAPQTVSLYSPMWWCGRGCLYVCLRARSDSGILLAFPGHL